MKNKNTITIALVLAIAVTALAFGSYSPSTNKLFSIEQKAKAQSTSQIPTSILYDHVFRLTDSFKRQAESQQSNGEIQTAFSNYFKEKAQLTDWEDEILKQTASQFIQEAQSIDNQAEALIEQIRSNSSENNVQSQEELNSLQEQRNNTALSYRNQLNQSLGSAKFGEFDNFVQGEFASGFQLMPLSTQ